MRSKLVVAILCAFSAGVTPVFAASLGVNSANLTSFRTCVLSASSSSTTVEADTFIQLDKLNQNNGSATTMNVQSRSSQDRRAIVGMDATQCAPAIPATATIRLATLRLYATAVPTACRTENAYRITSTWAETTVTWTNQPTIAGSATSSMNIGGAPCTNTATNAYVTGWDVTSDVAAYVAGTATNWGWMIKDSAEGSGTTQTATYRTNEQNSALSGPQLVIDYTT